MSCEPRGRTCGARAGPERGAALGVRARRGRRHRSGDARAGGRRSDAVVHLVSIIVGGPADFERVMAQGTRDLVAAAREAGVRRFVLMSALGLGEETKELRRTTAPKWDMEQPSRAGASST